MKSLVILNTINLQKTRYKERALMSTIRITTNIWTIGQGKNTSDWKLEESERGS